MPAPITSSVYQADYSSPFRERWAGRTVNDGDVRDIRGFHIDVSGQSTRGEKTYRSTVTGGSGTTLYDPEHPPHAPRPLDTGLPSSSLLILQDNFNDRFQAAQQADAAGVLSPKQNPYAVSMPAWVDIQQREETRPEQITSVGYFNGVEDITDLDSQKAFTSTQVERLKALAKIERDLGSEYGEPVKLAWDGAAGEYMMLRPGQAGYDEVLSVNDLVRNLGKDLGRLGLFNPDEIARLIA
ncbi:hypothetical protein ACIQC9_07715 [Brevundimonas sp. NPDC092305]|uniref:hypothetical protein n=1 Tax=Brevundimonas sp. NPDC092305 TaxID=3363957 RepID=UPI00380D8359